MRNILFYFMLMPIISCNNKTELIQSKAMGNLFLLKNPPKYYNQINRTDFYIYSSKTKYFLDHKEDDPSGLSLGEEQLSFYDNDRIAVFSITKCKKDTTKLLGELRFDNKYGNFYRPDTIIYKCK